MPKPTVGYWDIRGLAEPIRYLLHYKNIEFEDKRYGFEDRSAWENDKFNLKLDFPNLPYYIDGNIRLSQSTSILRYLAAKHGLDGKTEQEELRISLAEQQIVDLRMHIINLFYNADFEKVKPEFVSKVPAQLKLVADFLADRKFLAGDTLTYVDFMAYDTIDFYRYLIPNLPDDFPTLKKYQDTIKNLPELQNYLKSSKYVRWPIFRLWLLLEERVQNQNRNNFLFLNILKEKCLKETF